MRHDIPHEHRLHTIVVVVIEVGCTQTVKHLMAKHPDPVIFQARLQMKVKIPNPRTVDDNSRLMHCRHVGPENSSPTFSTASHHKAYIINIPIIVVVEAQISRDLRRYAR